MPAVEALSLHAVLTRVRRSLALNFPQALWVRAELSQVSERRGHRYLDLVEKGDSASPIARCQASVWSRAYSGVLRKRGNSAAEVLVAGQEVCLQVEVDFHEVYGLKLNVVDWDPAYTLGQLELRRREIVDQLRKAGMLELNKQQAKPLVLQRIAVLTSSAAAGYADFQAQLQSNPYGYSFSTTLFDVVVQGPGVEASVPKALRKVATRKAEFDAIVILRGGGSKLDLAGFDNLAVGEAIARSPLPVLVGIGHEIDETLPDLVAHTSLKTPTALAEYLITTSATFEGTLHDLGRRVARSADQHNTAALRDLDRYTSELRFAAQARTRVAAQRVTAAEAGLSAGVIAALRLANALLDRLHDGITALDPAQVLARGYAAVSRGSQRVTSAHVPVPGEELVLHFYDGTVATTVSE